MLGGYFFNDENYQLKNFPTLEKIDLVFFLKK